MTDTAWPKWRDMTVSVEGFYIGTSQQQYRYWMRGYHIHSGATHGNPVGYGSTPEAAKNRCWAQINDPANFVWPGNNCYRDCPRHSFW